MNQEMLRQIKMDTLLTSRTTGINTLSELVIEALTAVKRHEFVPPSQASGSYENRPLPIGQGQTISQPFIVAIMTEVLKLKKTDRVLEIGTGSGYQAAVLAELAKQVYSLEIIPELGEQAQKRLQHLGYENVNVRVDDGYQGWPEKAPFDAIIVTAASPIIPPPLVEQLKNGGVMVMPLGAQYETQCLIMISKDEKGKVSQRNLLAVSFVPLTGER